MSLLSGDPGSDFADPGQALAALPGIRYQDDAIATKMSAAGLTVDS